MRIFVFVGLVVLIIAGWGVNCHPGTGQKIGQVVKLGEEGFLKVTCEGQLIRGGLIGGSGTFGTQPFDFTVESHAVAQVVAQCLSNQTEVLISYRVEGIYSAFRSGSQGHFLTSIEPLIRRP